MVTSRIFFSMGGFGPYTKGTKTPDRLQEARGNRQSGTASSSLEDAGS
jgi:hypothetical protein